MMMTGADAVFSVAARHGIDVCFANPGTTEMAFVAALDRQSQVRAVPALFEGVAAGAADGYARVRGVPALTLLHLGPGLANASANLHNARRAHTPLVNLVGDHTTAHRPLDAPLTSDIESLAATTASCVRAPAASADVVPDLLTAIDSATRSPGSVSTVIVPADLQDAPVDASHERVRTAPVERVPAERVESIAASLRGSGEAATLLLGGSALTRDAMIHAAQIAATTGAALYRETFHARADAGADVPYVPRLPYFPEQAVAALRDSETVVLVGANEPVGFFGYEGVPGRLATPGTTVTLAVPGEDAGRALADLSAAVGAAMPWQAHAPVVPAPSGALDTAAIGTIVAAHVPDGAIVSVEGSAAGNAFYAAAATSPPHTTLSLTGGAIGQGLPVALGASIAAPDRQVIALQADGSAQYTLQALWTMAREQTRVAIVIVANHKYGILRTELRRIGIEQPGAASEALTSLAAPSIDWVALARGYGVEATRVRTCDELAATMGTIDLVDGPYLIQADVEEGTA